MSVIIKTVGEEAELIAEMVKEKEETLWELETDIFVVLKLNFENLKLNEKVAPLPIHQ